MEVLIRPVRPEDAGAFAEIRRQPTVMEYNNLLPSERGERDRDELAKLGADHHVFVAEADGQVVGFARMVVFGGRQRHVGTVNVNVHDAYQGQGIGRRLLATLLDLADNYLALTRVQLEVWADNERAIHLYETLGFEPEGRRRKAVLRRGEYVDVLIMGRLR
ncbi:MAG: GNAT family N-acetyltransferase [Symbiobacteriia bacterium]